MSQDIRWVVARFERSWNRDLLLLLGTFGGYYLCMKTLALSSSHLCCNRCPSSIWLFRSNHCVLWMDSSHNHGRRYHPCNSSDCKNEAYNHKSKPPRWSCSKGDTWTTDLPTAVSRSNLNCYSTSQLFLYSVWIDIWPGLLWYSNNKMLFRLLLILQFFWTRLCNRGRYENCIVDSGQSWPWFLAVYP